MESVINPVQYVGIVNDLLSEKALKILSDAGCQTTLVQNINDAPELSVVYFSGESQVAKFVNRHVRHVIIPGQGKNGEIGLCLGVALRDNKHGKFSEAVLNAARAAERLLAANATLIPTKQRSAPCPWLAKTDDLVRSFMFSLQSRRQEGVRWSPTSRLWPQKPTSVPHWRKKRSERKLMGFLVY